MATITPTGRQWKGQQMLKFETKRSKKPLSPRRKARKRPRKQEVKGSRKPDFGDTRLGWLMKYESPVLYSLIVEIRKMPDKDMLRSIAGHSSDPFFKTDEFWMELARYVPDKVWKPSGKEEVAMIRKKPYSTNAIEKILDTSSL